MLMNERYSSVRVDTHISDIMFPIKNNFKY